MTTVSVVITTYNHARFLNEAIESILAQTRLPNEIIVVDDGSTDDPASVITRHQGIRLIRQPNQGLSAARNTGLAAGNGDCIVFLDADDKLRPNMIERTLAALEADPNCAFAYGAYALVDEAGAMQQFVRMRASGGDCYAAFLTGNIIGMHGTVLYRRKIVVEAGGFDRFLSACEDYDLYLRLVRYHPVIAIDAVLADYRRHSSNMSRANLRMLMSAVAVLDKHRATAATRPDWAQAYSRGIADWKAYYANCQLGSLARSIRSGRGVANELSSSLAMFYLAPRQTMNAVVEKIVRAVRIGPSAQFLARKARFAVGSERPIVLMYHRVAKLSVDPWQLAVRPERFAKQISMLSEARHIVPMRWLASQMRGGKFPRRAAAVTFDDGYVDFLDNALPTLRSLNCPVTVFLKTGSIDRPEGFWWDHLARLVLDAPTLPERLDMKVGNVQIETLVEEGPGGRRKLLDKLSAAFRSTPEKSCWVALEALRTWAGFAPEAPGCDRALTSFEVGGLGRDALVEVGAHTVTHPSMPSLDAEAAVWEASESRRRCEDWIGRPVEGFSYPFGDYDPASVAAVQSAGLSYACTTEPEAIKHASEPFKIQRIAVHDWEEDLFSAQVLRHG